MSTPVTPQPDFLQTLETELEAAAVKLKDEILAVAEAIGPPLEAAAVTMLVDLGEIALGAVLTQAPLVISGAEKFGAAVASVVQTVEAKGIAPDVQSAQTAVQAAYLKAKQVVGASLSAAAGS